MDYHTKKAKRMYELFLKGQPCKKVYAAMEKDNKYIVLQNAEGKKYKYQLAGGGVEDGEDNITAVKREMLEELNINADAIKSLGFVRYKTTWTYDGKEFDVDYESEIFLAKLISYANNKTFGLEGEFEKNQIHIAIISKDEMLANVYEFSNGIIF